MKIQSIFLLFLFLLASDGLSARTYCARVGKWKVVYDNKERTFSYLHDGSIVISGSQPSSAYTVDGVETTLSSADCESVQLQKGDTLRFYLSSTKAPAVRMKMTFTEQRGALLMQLGLSAEVELSSRLMIPMSIIHPLNFAGAECRMLKVPFDNDDFVRYQYHRLDTTMTSYEVTTIFDGVSRHGIVVGSVDHDRWKSAVDVTGRDGNTVTSLRAYSGVSTKETHDVLPHGLLRGRHLDSATFMLAEAKDWRDGMELFAAVCDERQPGRRTWQGGTPIGWQSWGVMAMKNNIDVDMAVADFYAVQLRNDGFAAADGLQIMSIDSWDNLSHEQRLRLTSHCAQQGQIVGIYRSPFSLWWGSESDLNQPLYNGCEYSARECVLTAYGKAMKYDGAFCLDPTHPAVKERMRREMDEARRQGFRYVKVDFITNGIIQADRYYNKEVTTAVQAYNEGMTYFASQCYCADGEPMFIALSIAPIFPYQYGNSRRIACDTWGKIGQSEYAMNAISGGWWTNGFYQRNDPDHIVLVGNDAEKETEGENRARLTTGIVSGMLLLADNYDLSDNKTGCGEPKLSVERARLLLSNDDINELARSVKRSFRPVYGYRPFDGKPQSADNIVTYQDGTTTYVAIINYSSEPMSGTLPFDLLGVKGTRSINELWTGQKQSASKQLQYSIPAKDARIYCVE